MAEGFTLRNLDLGSWYSLLTTVLALALITLVGVGIRLLVMVTIQARRERANRQINERLRVLIAAYKTLGGSFTGNLTVDPTHLRDLAPASEISADGDPDTAPGASGGNSSERARRIRDAVEAALSDILLLGTEEQVRLAERAARELTAGRPVHTHDLVASLRKFIREALDLEPIPPDVVIPMQGPVRPAPSGGRGGGDKGQTRSGGRGGGAAGAGPGMAMGVGGTSLGSVRDDDNAQR